MKNQKSIRYNWHQADETLLEGVFRTRRPPGWRQAIRVAYENGALFDAWTEYWNYDRWVTGICRRPDVDMDFYTLRERDSGRDIPVGFHSASV